MAPPRLDLEDLHHDGQLWRRIDRVLLGDDHLRRRRIRILVRGAVLKRRVPDDAFQSFLRLEEAWAASSSTGLLLVARCAFEEGRRNRREER